MSACDCDCDHDQYHKHKQFLPFIISSNRSSLRYHVPLQVRGSATFSLFGTSLTHLWDISGTSLRHPGDIFRTSSFSSIFFYFFFFAVFKVFLFFLSERIPGVSPIIFLLPLEKTRHVLLTEEKQEELLQLSSVFLQYYDSSPWSSFSSLPGPHHCGQRGLTTIHLQESNVRLFVCLLQTERHKNLKTNKKNQTNSKKTNS